VLRAESIGINVKRVHWIGFAIAGCWSLVSGTVVVLALRAFGIIAG
jgi:ribose/xylose/arabinose/galactoside ABC-type transport system permease subunit